MLILVVAYTTVNAAYLHVVPLDEMRAMSSEPEVPKTTIARAFGAGAGEWLAILICISTFGAANPVAALQCALFLRHGSRWHGLPRADARARRLRHADGRDLVAGGVGVAPGDRAQDLPRHHRVRGVRRADLLRPRGRRGVRCCGGAGPRLRAPTAASLIRSRPRSSSRRSRSSTSTRWSIRACASTRFTASASWCWARSCTSRLACHRSSGSSTRLDRAA